MYVQVTKRKWTPTNVVSLFTSVLIQVVMDVIREWLVKNKTLSKHTDLSADNIMSLLEDTLMVKKEKIDKLTALTTRMP